MLIYKTIRKCGERGIVLLVNILILTLLFGCSGNNNNKKETDGKNTLLHRLELIKKPICRLETYKDIVECLLRYNEVYKQSNRDKEEMIINY